MQQPGRPREFDAEEALSRIVDLFWEQGYEATGLGDITAATGLGKASLYAAFGNKRAMYLKALAQFEARAVAGAVALLRGEAAPPLARLEAFLSAPLAAAAEGADRRGCFLCNAAADRAALDPEAAAIVRRGFERMRAAAEAALREAHPGRAAEDLAARAQLAVAIYSGLQVMSRADVPADALGRARDAAVADLARPASGGAAQS